MCHRWTHLFWIKNRRGLVRTARAWALPLVAGVLSALATVWFLDRLPFPWGSVATFSLVTVATAAIRIASGGAVVAIVSWLVPVVLVGVTFVLWPRAQTVGLWGAVVIVG